MRKASIFALFISLLLFIEAGPLPGQVSPVSDDTSRLEIKVHESARHNFRVVTVLEGLDNPWSLAWLPSGEMLFVERTGRLSLYRDAFSEPALIKGFPPVYREKGQGGFMEILPHPDFENNRLLYLSYGKPNADKSEGTTTVVRGRLEGLRIVELEELFEANAWLGNNNHFSGRMVFDHKGYLFLAVGDRMVTPNLMFDHPSQDLTNHMGTIIRLHDDGRVPTDNPFLGRIGALPEIWSYGHRNIQGLAVHPWTGDVWLNEHGPRGGDELNLVVKGGNYGWPVVSYGVHYNGTIFTRETSRDGMLSPDFAWTPSIGISGLMFYTGDKFPWWQGSVFSGGLVGEQLSRLTLLDNRPVSEETLLSGELGRIREIKEGPDGLIYITTDNRTGDRLSKILRLEPVHGDVQPPPED